jgi:hypothetical protein
MLEIVINSEFFQCTLVHMLTIITRCWGRTSDPLPAKSNVHNTLVWCVADQSPWFWSDGNVPLLALWSDANFLKFELRYCTESWMLYEPVKTCKNRETASEGREIFSEERHRNKMHEMQGVHGSAVSQIDRLETGIEHFNLNITQHIHYFHYYILAIGSFILEIWHAKSQDRPPAKFPG